MVDKKTTVHFQYLDYKGVRHLRIVDILLILEEADKTLGDLKGDVVLKFLKKEFLKTLAAK